MHVRSRETGCLIIASSISRCQTSKEISRHVTGNVALDLSIRFGPFDLFLLSPLSNYQKTPKQKTPNSHLKQTHPQPVQAF